MKKVLVISDTHSYIDDRIIKYASEADYVIHAGDVGSFDVIGASIVVKGTTNGVSS